MRQGYRRESILTLRPIYSLSVGGSNFAEHLDDNYPGSLMFEYKIGGRMVEAFDIPVCCTPPGLPTRWLVCKALHLITLGR
jgi:hypothetical protein